MTRREQWASFVRLLEWLPPTTPASRCQFQNGNTRIQWARHAGCGWHELQVAHVSQYTYRTDGKRGPCTTYSHIKLIEWHLRRWFRWCVNDTSVKKLMWFPKERIWDVLVIWWFKVILGDFEHHVSHVCEYTYRAGHKRESCNTCSHIKS